MKKNLKIIFVSMILATTAIFSTACSNNEGININQKNSDNSGYIETDLILPTNNIFVRNINFVNNELNLLGNVNNMSFKNFTLQMDNTFLESEIELLNNHIDKLNKEGKNISDIVNNNNNFILLVSDMNANKSNIDILSNERTKSIELDEGYYFNLYVANNGDIFVMKSGQNSLLSRYDKEGNFIKEYNISLDDFIVNNNELIVINNSEKVINIYDLETGEEKTSISKKDLDFGTILTSDAQGNIFVCGKNGVEKLLKDTKTFENIIDGNSTTFGLSTVFLQQVIPLENNEFIALFNATTDGFKVVKYTYEENLNDIYKTHLNLYMLEDNAFIKQAVFEYKKQNPTVNINIEVGYDENKGITKEDAIKTLNTEILAGNGPDILILDGLNEQTYIDKGVLMDISDIILPLVQNGELMTNIINPYIKDNKIFCIPTKFTPSTIWGNNSIVDNYTGLDSLANWQKENEDKKVLYPMKPETLIEKTFKINNQILNENGEINQDELKKYLENIKILSSEEEPKIDINGIKADEARRDIASLEYLTYNDIQFHMQDVRNKNELDYTYASIFMNKDAKFKLNNNYFNPLNIVGINSKTKRPEIAKEILSIILGEELQSMNMIAESGFPINKKVFDTLKVVEEEQNNNTMAVKTLTFVDIDKQIDIFNNQVSKQQIADFFKEVEKVSIPTKEDEILMNFIIEESKGYFKGEKDIEQTTKSIIEKTKTYLAE